jgi:hypothetical protein
MPMWGLWLDGRFYFSTDRGSRKSRNLTDNAGAVVHLESGDEVVILEGVARPVTEDTEHLAFEEAYARKYDVCLSEIPGEVAAWAVEPRVAFAWREGDFPRTTTRWTFDR